MLEASVVMGYYNRPRLLETTLESIRRNNVNFDKYEVVIVDDGSDPDKNILGIIPKFNDINIIPVILPDREGEHNPVIPYNIGIKVAKGSIVVLTNPENYHLSRNILDEMTKEIITDRNSYIIGACYSLTIEQTEMIDRLLRDEKDGINLIREYFSGDGVFKSRGVPPYSTDCWYSHSVFRNDGFHFLTAIDRAKLIKIGGFDEDFKYGTGYDDTELIARIKNNNMRLVFRDDLICLHQYHSRAPVSEEKSILNYRLYCSKLRANNKVANVDRDWGII